MGVADISIGHLQPLATNALVFVRQVTLLCSLTDKFRGSTQMLLLLAALVCVAAMPVVDQEQEQGLLGNSTLHLDIQGTFVRYFTMGSESHDMAVFGIPGKSTTPAEFAASAWSAAKVGRCQDTVKVYVIDFGASQYNYLGVPVVGNLQMNVIMDAFIDKFGAGKKVRVVGYSKGGQAVQRYSLVSNAPQKFILGCGSSWTFLNSTIDWIYGISNFPDGLQMDDILSKVVANQYLIICGDADFGSDDNSTLAMESGASRIERASTLYRHFNTIGANVQMIVVPGAAHNHSDVIPTSGNFLCN